MRTVTVLLAAILSGAAVLGTAAGAATAPGGLLTGLVTDRTSGEPLAGAYVTVSATGSVLSTDAQGRFCLPVPASGQIEVRVSHIGYRAGNLLVTLPSGTAAPLTVPLVPDPLPVADVIVTARGRVSPLAALGGSAGVVAGPQLTDRPMASVAEATGGLPGVALGGDMPWSLRPHIRGLSRDHVVFLVDGNRVSTTTELAAQYGTIPPADVERVEVLKGPVSVLYGTGSTGGVINAIPYSGHFAPRLRATGATWLGFESVASGWSSYARAAVGSPRLFAMASQSYRDYGSYTAGDGRRIPNSQFADRQSHVHAGVRVSAAQTADLRCQWFEATDVGIPGGGGVFPAAASVRYPATRRWLGEATWERQVPSSWWRQSQVRLFLQTIDRRTEVTPNTVAYLAAGGGKPLRRVRPLRIEPSADHDSRGLRWNNSLAWGRHELVTGVEGWEKALRSRRRRVSEVAVLAADSAVVRTDTTTVEDRPLPNSTIRPVGVYAEDEYTASPRLTLCAGVRADAISIQGRRTYVTYVPATEAVLWEPADDLDYSLCAQGRATYRPASGCEVYLSLARSFRAPGLEERFLYVDLGDLVRLGDPGLDSEDGAFVESGFQLQTANSRLNGQAFANRIRGLVIERPAEYEGRAALLETNAGEALLWGFEAGAEHAPLPRAVLSASVAYVRGTDEQAGTNLPAMPPLGGRLGIRYGRQVWFEADLDLVAAQKRVAAGEASTPGHQTVQLGAGLTGWMWAELRHTLTAGVRNALDADYRDHLATSRGFPLTAPGRSFYLTWSTQR